MGDNITWYISTVDNLISQNKKNYQLVEETIGIKAKYLFGGSFKGEGSSGISTTWWKGRMGDFNINH